MLEEVIRLGWKLSHPLAKVALRYEGYPILGIERRQDLVASAFQKLPLADCSWRSPRLEEYTTGLG